MIKKVYSEGEKVVLINLNDMVLEIIDVSVFVDLLKVKSSYKEVLAVVS